MRSTTKMEADSVEHGADFGEVLAAGLVKRLADLGQLLDDGLVFGMLAIQHAQRIGLGAALAVGTHLMHDGLQCLTQSLVVARAIFGAAD